MSQELLTPNGDGSLSSWTDVPSGDAHYLDIDDYATGAHDSDTSYVRAPNLADDQMYVQLTDTSGLFDPAAVSGITIRVAARMESAGQVGGLDSVVLYAQVLKSDEVTALTDEVAANGGAGLGVGYAEYLINVQQQGTPTKADWDGARLELRQDYIVNGGADTTCTVRVTAARVEINWTPAQPQLVTAITGDSDRDFVGSTTRFTVTMTETVKRLTAGGYAVGEEILGLLVRMTYPSGDTYDNPVRYVSGDLSAGASTFVVDVPVVFRAGDPLSIAYDATAGELVAVDDAQEAQTMSINVANNLTKRVRRVLRDSSGNPINAASVKYALCEYANATPSAANYMSLSTKGSSTTSSAGLLDVQYTGLSEPGATIFGAFDYSSQTFAWPVVVD